MHTRIMLLTIGAALLLKNGDVVTGANVENASYGLTLCAETAAVAKIANEGWIGELAEVVRCQNDFHGQKCL